MFNSLSKYKFSPLHNQDGSPCYFRVTCLAIFAFSLMAHVITKPGADDSTSLVAEAQNFNPQEILASSFVDSEDVAAVGRSVNINTAHYQNDIGQQARNAVMIGQRGEISLNPLKTVANEGVNANRANVQTLDLNGSRINMPNTGSISIPTASISHRVPGSALQSSTAVQPPIPHAQEELVAANVSNVGPNGAVLAVANAPAGATLASSNASAVASAPQAMAANNAAKENEGDSFWSFFSSDESKKDATAEVSKEPTIDMQLLAKNRTQALSEMVNGISLLVACGKISSTYDKCSFNFSKKVRNNFDTKVVTNSDAFALALMAKGNQLADQCVRYEFSSTGVYRAYDNKGQLSQTCLQDPAIDKQIAAINAAIQTLDRNAQKAEMLSNKL